MRVGFTFDLRSDYLDAGYDEEETAEFDSEATIEAMKVELAKVGRIVNGAGGAAGFVILYAGSLIHLGCALDDAPRATDPIVLGLAINGAPQAKADVVRIRVVGERRFDLGIDPLEVLRVHAGEQP